MVPPRALELWLTEPVASDSVTVRLLDAAGAEITLAAVGVDPADARHVRATVPGLPPSTYTVVWTARSTVDGHTLSGSYAFRLGGGGAPGAAVTDGERPQPWAVATRWLTFLGAALVAGGFFFGRVILPPAGTRSTGETSAPAARSARRRAGAIISGAAVALAATLSEPLWQTRWPPAGTAAPTLTDAVQALPTAWWLRPASLVAALLLGLVSLAFVHRGRSVPAALGWGGPALGLTTLLGLSLTSHAAGRDGWRLLAVFSNVLHQWAIALWVGGLIHLALTAARSRRGRTGGIDDEEAGVQGLRRFSRYALGLVIVGVGTGVLNAGLLLPTLRALWESAYGAILLLKIAVLIPPLLLATFHRLALRRALATIGTMFRRTLRVEAALVPVVVLVGSTLALLAPPLGEPASGGREELNGVDLIAPLDWEGSAVGSYVGLVVEPADAGANAVAVRLLDAERAPLPADAQRLIRVTFTSLNHGVQVENVRLQPDGGGRYTTAGSQLSLDGWWRLAVTVRRVGVPDVVVPFYVLLPDPNVHGNDAVAQAASSAEAEGVYERGLAAMTGWHSVRYSQIMADGQGYAAYALHEVAFPSGQPAGYRFWVPGATEAFVVGDQSWQRRPGEAWEQRAASPPIPPSEWDREFTGATGFALGPVEVVNGEPSQVVTFVAPAATRRAVAWYVWWVGVESGQLRREIMVSRSHYMLSEFRDFDAPFTITAPVTDLDATPATTPIATPAVRADGSG